MLKIRLVNLPFAAYHLPSIGLTQLRGLLLQRFPGEVDVEICYANHAFASYFGLDVYDEIRGAGDHLNAGLAEWLFRREAFPELADNRDAYFARYYPGSDARSQRLRQLVLDRRDGLGAVLDRIIDQHRLAEADVVGCTSMFFENNVSFALARKLKERHPEVLTLLGGANCESPAGEELARFVTALDFVFSGPALHSLPQFVANLLAGQPEANHTIDGVFSKENCGLDDPADPASRFLKVAPMGHELSINQRIELDYDTFLASLDASFPEYEIKAILPFETSRGCWWGERAHCTFCGLNKTTMGYRAMQAENAVWLIQSLFKYRERCSVFMCVDNILQRDYVEKVFPRLDTPEENSIFYQLKANLTEHEVQAMAAARVKTITPGFESLATSTLKLMDKGVTAFHNLRVMKYCLLHDVFPGWNLLIGSPGEQEDVYEKYTRDLPLLYHLPPPQAVFSIHFNRFSPYFMHPEKFGLELEPVDRYAMVFPFDAATIANVAYDFNDANVDADYQQAMAGWIAPLEQLVATWRRRWYGAGELMPKLYSCERDGESFLYDSRSGTAMEYPVSPAAMQVLSSLDPHKKRRHLIARLGAEHPEIDVAAELAWLEERRLIFSEDESVMSLVLPFDPPPMSFRTNGLDVVRRRRAAAPAARPAIVPVARQRRRVA